MARAGRKGKTARRASRLVVRENMVAAKTAPEGEFKIGPPAIAASVAELLVNSRLEASF